MAEDHDLALRLGTAPGFVQVTQPVIVAHRIHGGNEMGDDARNVAGVKRLVATERAGGYPGGVARQVARRGWIAFHVRSVLVSCATGTGKSFDLYVQTFSWNFSAGRVAFLIGLPALALARRLAKVIKQV